MKIFISSLNVPIGYTTPDFPSIYWPLGEHRPEFSQSMLYYGRDVWRFTIQWYIILFCGVYSVTGLYMFVNYCVANYHSKTPSKYFVFRGVLIFVSYAFTSTMMAVISGSVVGLLTSAIYKAGSMTMSTWIPFTWAVLGVMYDISLNHDE
ncbi:hypothetical protein PSN45_001062 [Yamadazyma tenuis]|uniref:uncharacterized protein n=1 Tax=Candida tenuis TaxID=2315449 RepID=UPI00279CB395|nr:hypothetical protein PSN45_001062 [Yamadazyma tenuis]